MAGKSILDCINQMIENNGRITYEEWCNIRRTGTPEEIEEAVERMMSIGGYENLE